MKLRESVGEYIKAYRVVSGRPPPSIQKTLAIIMTAVVRNLLGALINNSLHPSKVAPTHTDSTQPHFYMEEGGQL